MFRLKLVAVSGALLMGASLSSLLAQGGCQDPLASNYAPDTSSDNSDCIYLDHAFQETGTENASSPTNGALFGQAFQVDPSDGQMVVGAPGDDSPGATSEGSVTILEEEEGCGFYSPELLTAPDGQEFSLFGTSVSKDGDIIAVGAPGPATWEVNQNSLTDFEGAVYLYHHDGTQWNFLTVFQTDNIDDDFGRAVAVKDNYVFVGVPGFDAPTGGSNHGAVVVLEKDESCIYSIADTLMASDAGDGASFGRALSVYGDRLLIGATGYDTPTTSNVGAAYTFTYDGTGWTEEHILLPAADAGDGDFGLSVDLGDDLAIVGAQNDETGRAYVFDLSGPAPTMSELTACDLREDDKFGTGVSIHGNYAVVGAYLAEVDDTESTNGGKAYIFRHDGDEWVNVQRLMSGFTNSLDNFGFAVHVDADRVLVSEYKGDPDGTSQAGQIFTYCASGDPAPGNAAPILAVSTTEADSYMATADINFTTEGIATMVYLEQSGLVLDSVAPVNNTGSFTVGTGAYVLRSVDSEGCTDMATAFVESAGDEEFVLTGKYVSVSQKENLRFGTQVHIAAGRGLVQPNLSNAALDHGVDALLTGVGIEAPGSIHVAVDAISAAVEEPIGERWGQFGADLMRIDIEGDDDEVFALIADHEGALDGINNRGVVWYSNGEGWQPILHDNPHALNNGPAGDQLGSVISVDGTTAAIAARNYDWGDGGNVGAILLFDYDLDSDTWTERTERIRNPTAQNGWPRDMELSGNTIVASYDLFDDGEANNANYGYASVFRMGGDGVWDEEFSRVGEEAGLQYAKRVALEGNLLAIGTQHADDIANNAGRVELFTHNGTEWVAMDTLTLNNTSYAGDPTADAFGSDVAIEGSLLAVGALSFDEVGIPNSGNGYFLFSCSGGSWNCVLEADVCDSAEHDRLGTSIDIQAGHIIIGANTDDAQFENAGSAYTFALETGCEECPEIVEYECDLTASDAGDLDLQTASDDGAFATDDITSLSDITIDVNFPATGVPVAEHDLIRFFLDGVEDSFHKVTSDDVTAGFVSFPLVSLADGEHEAHAEFVDLFGNTSDQDTLFFCISPAVTIATTDASGALAADGSATFSLDEGTADFTITQGGVVVTTFSAASSPVLSDLAPGSYLVSAQKVSGCATILPFTIGAEGMDFYERQVFHKDHDCSLPDEQSHSTVTTSDNARLGESVVLNGTVAAAGAPGLNGQGEVHIYNQQQDGSWVFAQYLEAPSAQYSNAFGAAIAFGGGYLFVGDPSSNDGGGSNGIVHIYEDQAGSWTLVQSLKHTSASSNAGDNFGWSIAYANDHLFVGATRSEISSPSTDLTGSVYAFSLQSGQFVQEQELRATGLGHQDKYGAAVAASGMYLAVGAPDHDAPGACSECGTTSNAGAVAIWKYDGSEYVQQGDLIVDDTAGQLGAALDVDGYTVLAGAPATDNNTGRAYLLRTENGSDWAVSETLTPADMGGYDSFGADVDLDANFALVGAWRQEDGGNALGAAYSSFLYDGNAWTDAQTIAACGGASSDYLGYSLDHDGGNIIIGAPGVDGSTAVSDGEGGSSTNGQDGAVYFFSTTEPTMDLVTTTMDPACEGEALGTITALTTGLGCVDYSWTGPDAYTSDATAGADTLEMLWAGDYELSVSYSSGCALGTTTVTVTEIPQIAISAVIGDAVTCTSADGDLDLTTTGGNGTYTWDWSTSETSEDISGLTSLSCGGNENLDTECLPDSYTVNIASGSCTADSTFLVGFQDYVMDFTAPIEDVIVCEDAADLVIDIRDHFYDMEADDIEVTLTNTLLPSEWNVSVSGETLTIDFSAAGGAEDDIHLFIRDSESCTDTAITFHVTEVPNLTGMDLEPAIASATNVADGELEVTTLGYGQALTLSRDGITVAFLGGDSTIFEGLATGGYDVVSEMLGGCMAYGYTFVESPEPVLYANRKEVSNHMTEDGLYGYSLDMAGDLAIVGAPSDTVNGVADAGQAVIYRRGATTWELEQTLYSPGVTPTGGLGMVNLDPMSDTYGTAVATDGTWMFVSAPTADAANDDEGAVYAYTMNGGEWTLAQTLTATNTNGWSGGDKFGLALSLEGDRLAVGSNMDNANGGQSALHIFENQAGTWTEVQVLSEDGENYSLYGERISLSGDVLVTSNAIYPSTSGPDARTGRAYIYRHDGTQFVLETQLDGENAGDNFGGSVALDGNTLVVGIPRSADAGSGAGSADVYVYNGDVWSLDGDLHPADLAAYDNFGVAAAIEGNLIIVGADGADENGAWQTGGVYMGFARENGAWNEAYLTTSCDTEGGDRFGKSVTIEGGRAMVGAWNDDNLLPTSGSVTWFELTEPDSIPCDLIAPDAPGVDLAMVDDSGISFEDDTTNVCDPTFQVQLLGEGTGAPVALDGVTVMLDGTEFAFTILYPADIANGYVEFTLPCQDDGTHEIIAYVTDRFGNVGEQDTLYIDIDTVDPVASVTAPNDTTLYVDDVCFADTTTAALGVAAFGCTDDHLHSCELSYEDINVDALCAGGVYDFERMWISTAMDTAGNMHADTAYQYVELRDTIRPMMLGDEIVHISCDQWVWDPLYQPTFTELAGVLDTAGNAIIDARDNCALDTVTIEYGVMSGGCFYDHVLIYRAYDICGNVSDSLYQVVQVDDLVDPTFTYVPADTMIACTENVMAYLELATSVDNCDPSVNMTFTDEVIPTACPEGYTIRRTFRAEDCGYNIAEQVQTITVSDTAAPILSIALTGDANVAINGCLAGLMLDEATYGSVSWTQSDDCGEVTVGYTYNDVAVFDCNGDDALNEGSHTVTRTFTVTATDCAGNATVETIDQVFVITDNTAPTISLTAPADSTVYLDASCAADAVVQAVSGDATGFLVDADDACDTDVAYTVTYGDDTTYTGVADGFGSFDILRTYSVTATDDCDNSHTETISHTIMVRDTISPVLTLTIPNDTALFADAGCMWDETPASTGMASIVYSDECSGSGPASDEGAAAACSLFFSEYAEGSGNNKYLEIYNPTDEDIDLTGYAFPSVSNAPNTPGEYEYWNEFPAGASIPAGGTYIIAHPSSDAGLLAGADHTFYFLSNGDDGFILVEGTEDSFTMVDAIGDWNGDPGSGWDVAGESAGTKDQTLRRKSDVTSGNGGDWTTSAGTDAANSEWIVLEKDYAILNGYEGYGTHEFTGTCGDAPTVTDVNSTAITYSDEVTVYTASSCYTTERTWTATVTDNNGNATTASAVQTITVSDTIAPVITAEANTTAACDFFGFDLSEGSGASGDVDFGCGLFFSEYAEGSSNNKYLEIYNPTSSDIDLTGYAFPNVANAPNTPGEYEYWNEFPAGASIAAGGIYIIAHPSSDAGLLAEADHTFTFLSNGDDGFMLVEGTEEDYVQIDAIGDWNGDPGSGWDVAGESAGTKDQTLRRKSNVTQGNGGDWTTSAGTDAANSEWIVLEKDYAILNGYEGYGTHEFTGSCGGTITSLEVLMSNGYVSFADNCELASMEATITLDGTPCEGAYDVVYTATDSCGNPALSVSQRIMLIDTVIPVLTVAVPQDTTLYADADCMSDYVTGVPYPEASATDNCDNDVDIASSHFDGTKSYSCVPSTGSFSMLRTYVYTATDNCGNDTTVYRYQNVTVLDTISPTFDVVAPSDLTVNIDAFCGANTSTTIGGMPTVSNAADNCDSTVDIDIDHEDSTPVHTCMAEDGTPEGSYTFVRTFTVTATDDCGNTTVQQVSQNLTAVDVTSPVITAVENMAAITYTLGTDCMVDLTAPVEPTRSATDACDTQVATTATYSDGNISYNCAADDGQADGSYSFARTWTITATDDCGNPSSQTTTQTVYVVDETAPVITPTWPEDYTADLDEDCAADLSTAAAGEPMAMASDACDTDVTGDAISITYLDHDTTYLAVNVDAVAEGGYTFTRTWTITATDDCGNSESVTHDQTITANDVMAPIQTLETLSTYSVEGCYGEVDLSPAAAGTPMVEAMDACDSEVDMDLTYSTDGLVFNEVVGDYSLIIDTISGPEEGVIGMTTVRMYIQTENEDDFVSAVAGDEINPTAIRTTTSFYQNVLGGPTANNYSEGLTLADPLVAYDSFVTIGIDAQAVGADGEQETTLVGSWAPGFETGGDVLINDFFGGSWFTVNPNAAAVAGPDHRVLLGQFTTDGQMSGQMFVQVFPNGVGALEQRISFTFGDCAEDDDTPEGSYMFTRRWESIVTDDANNQDTAVTYQQIQVLDTEAPQLTNTCGLENDETGSYDCPGEAVLDFDPVPVACDVQAVDNCDSEVNVNVFTETEGYIPTDAIRNYCAPATPEAWSGAQTCDERAPEVIRLYNFPMDEGTFVMADAENLIQVMSDGSMHIELEVVNAAGTGGFTFTADYDAFMGWNAWQAAGRNYKKDCAEIYPNEAVWQDWVFSLMSSGSMSGTGLYAGSNFTLTHQPANGYYGMQMGAGANNKNTNYGGSAWFMWQGNLMVDGNDMGTMASSGDVYMDLDCCLEWNVEYFYTALDDCGNPTGFHYTESMGSGIAADDATVSGGHTQGPVDISSIGGIKEPIRITGLAPNPTNDQSQLSFLVNENMRLRVDLYTMEGQLMQELYDGNAVTGVQYTMEIDAEALSAGMYQVRISSNAYLAVKKLLVAE
ncbi:MAG: T9SS C-terminal target domain-containing protein [Crocinitomicaceae bacterium TMED114]|nr:MAG: T9SS C-terminal target domain-containing protein [Crocinitomicaceae bacterium TMED114]